MPPAHSPSRLMVSLRVISWTTLTARSAAATYSSKPQLPWPSSSFGFRQLTMNVVMPFSTAYSTMLRPGARSST